MFCIRRHDARGAEFRKSLDYPAVFLLQRNHLRAPDRYLRVLLVVVTNLYAISQIPGLSRWFAYLLVKAVPPQICARRSGAYKKKKASMAEKLIGLVAVVLGLAFHYARCNLLTGPQIAYRDRLAAIARGVDIPWTRLTRRGFSPRGVLLVARNSATLATLD